jgi:hypothetical protein
VPVTTSISCVVMRTRGSWVPTRKGPLRGYACERAGDPALYHIACRKLCRSSADLSCCELRAPISEAGCSTTDRPPHPV